MIGSKVFFVDVDGVLTSGVKAYTSDGMPYSKEFYDKDFTAFKDMRANGFDIYWISGDDFINKNIAQNRNINFVSARGKCKGDCIRDILLHSGKRWDYSICVGDDIFDLPMLNYVDRFYIPKDAHWRLLDLAENEKKFKLIPITGGNGIINYISSIELKGSSLSESIDAIVALDNKERF